MYNVGDLVDVYEDFPCGIHRKQRLQRGQGPGKPSCVSCEPAPAVAGYAEKPREWMRN